MHLTSETCHSCEGPNTDCTTNDCEGNTGVLALLHFIHLPVVRVIEIRQVSPSFLTEAPVVHLRRCSLALEYSPVFR